MITDPAELFSSRSRSKLLLALFEFRTPVSLHELAEVTETSLCAAHHALRQLTTERIIQKKRRGKETHYTLDRKHNAVAFISALALAREKVFLSERCARYHNRARQSLRFASDSLAFISQVRALNANS